MGPDGILAVVVSFNGGRKTLDTVEALSGQVDHVLVVDNGSSAPSIGLLESIAGRAGVSVDFLGENTGIGFALNRGIAAARERGSRWLLTMDQDSIADRGMVAAFCDAVAANPGWKCLSPRLVLSGEPPAVQPNDETVAYAITSGNLVHRDVLEKVGPYDEEMFIDQVDFDFSLRVRKAGFEIHRIAGAVLHHELGDAGAPRSFLGNFHTYHSPLRRYYGYRNFGILAARHARAFPGFIAKLGLVHLLQLLTIALYGRQRARSFLFIGRGLLDSIRRRLGRYGAPR